MQQRRWMRMIYSTLLGKYMDNQLNNVWFQAEEIFPVNGTPEVREQVFWIPVSQSYYELAQKIEVFVLGAMDPSRIKMPGALCSSLHALGHLVSDAMMNEDWS